MIAEHFDVLDPPRSRLEIAGRDGGRKSSPESSKVRRVLCAVDVARSGPSSLAMASLLAERFHASLDALYAPPRASALRDRGARVQRLITEHNAEERLFSMVAAVKRKVCVSSFVTRGNASAVIVNHSERYRSDLIVMASSARRRFAAPSGTISPVTAYAPCAVLTVGDRFQPAALRRILLPVGPAGVELPALSWITTLASRFDAEVGVLRIGEPRSGLWQQFRDTLGPAVTAGERDSEDVPALVAQLCGLGIDAYEIAHPGGADDDALSSLCESGAFDAAVMGQPAAGDGKGRADLVAAVRTKTNAPVLSIRTLRAPMLFAPSHFEPLPRAVGADWVQP
jgi:nucleotide-binding universal stress UspA family protein